jgi:hypothetical protein
MHGWAGVDFWDGTGNGMRELKRGLRAETLELVVCISQLKSYFS